MKLGEGQAPVLFDLDMRRPETRAIAGGSVALCSVRCPGSEGANEDALGVFPRGECGGVLAVADGMGGHLAGARAARMALESLGRSVESAPEGEGSLRGAILDGIEAGHAVVRSFGIGAGTTLAVVELGEDWARAYHVGDSEILMAGQRGAVRFQNVPHSPTGYGVEAGLIDPGEALEHEDRHLLSNAVGLDGMRIDVGPVVPLRPRDVILLGSDGLYDNLCAEEIVETVRRGPLERAARRLVGAALERMREPEEGRPSKPDDLTFLLFRRSRR
jgi:serine/threonine protein phosphatase PrpC